MLVSYSNPFTLADLPNGWELNAIEDLCTRVTSGGTPSRSVSEYYEGGQIRWFKTQELRDCILYDSDEKITDAGLANSSAKLFPPNTVLLALYGDGKTITSLGILDREAATNQACCAMIANPSKCDHRFLFYSLKRYRSDLVHLASGGAQRNLSGQIIRRFAIPTPPLQTQSTIADVLSALDKKIEVNHQTNSTLEAIARALFKSWFVDFDPVLAKAAVRGEHPTWTNAQVSRAALGHRHGEGTRGNCLQDDTR